MPTKTDIDDFLAGHRVAVVGVSAGQAEGNGIAKAFAKAGYDVVPVHPDLESLEDLPCTPSLAAVDPPVDGVVVVVNAEAAKGVVDDAIAAGVPRVWLYQGASKPGAVSPEAVDACRTAGVPVVDGACPFMFLEPVGMIHKLHGFVKKVRHTYPTDDPRPA